MVIKNGLVFNSETEAFEKKDLIIENEKIVSFSCCTSSNEIGALDANNSYIVPGLIDIHTHGAMGHSFFSGKEEDFFTMEKFYLKHGITSVFPTTITAPICSIFNAIKKIKECAKKLTLNIRGVHIEGPYLSEEKRGAHCKEHLIIPDNKVIKTLIDLVNPLKAHITIAPEIEGGLSAISYLKELGSSVSIGHTTASGEIIEEAICRGANCFTHLFNGMHAIDHKCYGALVAALVSDCYTELICDNVHIDPHVVELVQKVKKEKLVLVSDSISAAGYADGEYLLGDMEITVRDSVARIDNNSLAGSTITVFKAMENLMLDANIPFERALISATKTPAQVVNIYDTCGSLDIGKDADILVLNRDYSIKHIFIKGKEVAIDGILFGNRFRGDKDGVYAS